MFNEKYELKLEELSNTTGNDKVKLLWQITYQLNTKEKFTSTIMHNELNRAKTFEENKRYFIVIGKSNPSNSSVSMFFRVNFSNHQ